MQVKSRETNSLNKTTQPECTIVHLSKQRISKDHNTTTINEQII